MFQLGGFMQELSISVNRYTKTLDETMQVQLRQAARAWLRAVLVAVPVWTGTARGSLKPLGAYLRVAVPISPIAFRRGKGPEIGAGQSSFTFGTPKPGLYTFEFNEQVAHYLINEFNDVSEHIHLTHPTPWESFQRGEEAFQKYVDDVLPGRLPRIEDFISQKQIKIY